jgi:hypothetical protein
MPDSPTDAVDSNVQGADVNTTAESSGAGTEGVENKSMLDAVSAALDSGSEESPGSVTQDSEADSNAADPKVQAEGEVDAGDLSPEELGQLSKKAQRRFRYLASAKGELSAEVGQLRPRAEGFDRLVGMMRQNNLTGDEVNRAFQISGLMKNKPEEALKALAPIVQTLLRASGYSLPDDLKQRVEAGELTQQAAMELSVSRARGTTLEAHSKLAEEERQAAEQAQKQKAIVDLAEDTAHKWQAEKAKSDPDWHLKHDRVVKEVKLLVMDDPKRFPHDAKEARDLFEEALKTVNAELRKLRPRPQPKTHISGDASSQTKPEPKSMEEAMQLALAG